MLDRSGGLIHSYAADSKALPLVLEDRFALRNVHLEKAYLLKEEKMLCLMNFFGVNF